MYFELNGECNLVSHKFVNYNAVYVRY
jgi:hypothetical protein